MFVCKVNWPLSQCAFQSQYKFIKSQLAGGSQVIYIVQSAVKKKNLWQTRTNPVCSRMEGLNLRQLDYKLSTFTTQPDCLLHSSYLAWSCDKLFTHQMKKKNFKNAWKNYSGVSKHSPIIIQNSSNPSSWKNLDVRPYDRVTMRPYDRTTVQGATFNICG